MAAFGRRMLYCHRPPSPSVSPTLLKLWPRSCCLYPVARFSKPSGSVGLTLHGIKSLSSVRSMSSSLVTSEHPIQDFNNIIYNCTVMTTQDYQSDFYRDLVKKESLKCLVTHTARRTLGWILDSGCARHLTGDRALFTTLEEVDSGDSVMFGNGRESKISGRGKIKFPFVGELENVQYVEGLPRDILSVSEFCDDGFQVKFTKYGCFVINKQGECVLKGFRDPNDLYAIYSDPLFFMVPAGFLVAEGQEEVSFVKLTTTTMEEEEEEDNDNSSTNDDDYYDLLSVEGKKIVLKEKIEKSQICLPWESDVSPDDAICFGSSRGWLAFIYPRNSSIYLYNSFLVGPYFPLPSLISSPRQSRRCSKNSSSSSSSNNNNITTECMIPREIPAVSSEHGSEDCFKKIVSSSLPPYIDNFILMTIQGYQSHHQLAFCWIFDSSWTALDGTLAPYRDLIYFEEHELFYALGCCGLEAWDLCNPDSPKSTFITESMPPTMSFVNEVVECCCASSYLVESSGDLLMVNRYYSKAVCSKTVAFDVYKLDFVRKDWVYVPSLGDRVLIVGANHAVSLSSHGFPGLIPNSIYFTAYDTSISNDLGFFNLEDKSIYRRHLGKKKVQFSPTWIVP